MKILFTGGHITPAIAVADELHARLPKAEIIFVGRATSLEGSGIDSEEARIVGERGFRFLPISPGRLTRALTILTVLGIVRIPFGFFRAISIVLSERPDVIVSFGGYVALPIVIAGWMLGIPSLTHEQTMVPGLANRIIGRFAKKICVSFPQTARVFDQNKTVVSGLPIRRSLFAPAKKARFSIGTKPLIFFTGGSTGAQSLNRVIYSAVANLSKRYSIIHQTGRIDFPKAPKIDDNVAIAYLDERDYAWVLNRAKLVVGRAGANTVGEIAILGKVAIFVPLPWSAGNEQYENARVLQEAGSAVILEQKNLSAETLVDTIEKTFSTIGEFQKNAASLALTIPHDAAQKIVSLVEGLVIHA